jgi:hypothetical protein
MPLSFKDSDINFTNLLKQNNLLLTLFNNIFIVAIILVIFTILILNFNISESGLNIGKVFIYSLILNILILIIHNKTIKIYYNEKNIKKEGSEFISMMDNNTRELIDGRNEIIKPKLESDIVNFLNN